MLAEAHDAMGWVHSLQLEWAKAEESFRRALELNPSLTTTSTDFVLSTLLPEGKLDEAMRQLEVALSADPLSADVRRTLSMVQISAGLYDNALDNCRRALALDSEVFGANTRCEQALLHKGEVAEAIAMMEKFIADTPVLKVAAAAATATLVTRTQLPGGAPKQRRSWRGMPAFPSPGNDLRGAGRQGPRVRGDRGTRRYQPSAGPSWLNRPELALLHGDPRVAALRKKFGLPQLAGDFVPLTPLRRCSRGPYRVRTESPFHLRT